MSVIFWRELIVFYELQFTIVRDWRGLTDEGVTGITYQELAEYEDSRKDIWKSMDSNIKTTPLIGKLKREDFA